MTTTGDHAAALDAALAVIARHAGELRALGVSRVHIDGTTIEFTEPAPIIHIDGDRHDASREVADPLDDPATFGGVLPSLRRRGES